MEFRPQTNALTGASRGAVAGFTMLELLVTMSMAAILLGLGIPMFRETIARNRLVEQSNDLISGITLARSQAITANQRTFFCRANSAAANVCAGSAGDWQFWLVRNAAGTVLRRGSIPTYDGAVVVTSTLDDDEVAFGSDGLARTNGVLVNGEQITVCSNYSATDNQRVVTLGAGSRVSTERVSGGC